VGRVWPRHEQRGRPLNAIVRWLRTQVPMGTSEALQALAVESWRIVAYAWPITAVLFLAAVMALSVGLPLRNAAFRGRLMLPALTYIFPVVVLFLGALLRYDGPPAPAWVEPAAWRGIMVWVFVVLHVAALVAVTVLLRGARIRAAAIVLPGVWFTLVAGFLAIIAIVGRGL
jgi:hypothetical protein